MRMVNLQADLQAGLTRLSGACPRAASHRDEATLRQLQEWVSTMQSLIADRKPENYLEHDSKFHFGI
jgi:DNA-binding GntR family transcriptional regulator